MAEQDEGQHENGATPPMRLLTREEILAANDAVEEMVAVPEWSQDGQVRVVGLTANEYNRWQASLVKGEGRKQKMSTDDVMASLCSQCMVDAQRNRLFPKVADVALLGEKSAVALNRVFKVASRLNGTTDEDVEEIAGNSDRDRSDILL